MYTNAFGNSISIGLSNAMDALASQAFGAGNLRRVGEIASRGIAINLTFCIPIGLFWWFAEYVLVALHQPPDVIHSSSVFLRYMLIGLPANVTFEIFKRTLVDIGFAPLPLMITGLGAFTSAMCGYLLVYHSPLGFIGAPIAIGICYWLQLAIVAGLVFNYKIILPRIPLWIMRVIWTGNSALIDLLPEDQRQGYTSANTMITGGDSPSPSNDESITVSIDNEVKKDVSEDDPPSASLEKPKHGPIPDCLVIPITMHLFKEVLAGISISSAFNKWKEYLHLGLPSAIMLCVEWGSYEASSIIAGLLGTQTLATHSILATTASLAYMVPLGYGIAVGIRFGQCMGNRDVPTAKVVYRVGLYCIVAYSLVLMLFIAIVKDSWGQMYTSVEEVTRMTAKMLFLSGLYAAFDAFQCITACVLRGMAKPAPAAIANIVGFLGVGMVLAYILAIKTPMGLRGIWLSFLLAVVVAYILMTISIHRTDWDKASLIAYNKSRSGVKGADADPSISCPHAPGVAPSDGSDSGKVPLSQKDAMATVALETIQVEDAGILPISVNKQEKSTDSPRITTSTTNTLMNSGIPQMVAISDPSNTSAFPVYAAAVPDEAVPDEAVPEEVTVPSPSPIATVEDAVILEGLPSEAVEAAPVSP